MMYLETLLKTFDGKADVMVLLSSSTNYDCGLTMQDGCGNHYAKNWLEAINRGLMTETFIVKNVEVSFEEYMDNPQWKVILENVKSLETNRLNVESNEAAIRDAFGFY